VIAKSVVLACSAERAFALFTEHAGKWWPRERRHTGDAASVIRIEASGRFFERAHDGVEVELGAVRVFEPAQRLILDWYPGTGATFPTRVEVTFEPVAGGTQVTVVHETGAARPDLFSDNAAGYRRSWDQVFASLAAYAAAPCVDY